MSESKGGGTAAASSAGNNESGQNGNGHASEILKQLEREPGDRVTCVWVYGDFYRCNWWAPGIDQAVGRMIQGLEVSAYRVRKSRFVRAMVVDGKIVVTDATRISSN